MARNGRGQAAGPADFIARVGTAVLIGAVMLAALLWGGALGLGALIAVIAALAATEFYEIARREHRLPNEVFGIVAVALMPLAAARWGLSGLTGVVSALVAASLLWHLVFRQVRTSDTASTVFGAIYVGFTLSHLVLIRQLDSGTLLALATVISVWANDIFAYLIGSSLGRHKMAPTISPHKSWEGFAAGTAFTVLVWVAAAFVTDIGLGVWSLALVGVAASVAAIVGDLAESRLKREAGIKDSGSLLPGHGGFLDRFDSMILVSLVTYYLLVWMGAK